MQPSLACDVTVIRLLRQRSLGRSATLLQTKMSEEHSGKWLQQSTQYLTECKYNSDTARSGLMVAAAFEKPPQFTPVPTLRWFLTVYAQELMNCMDHNKASITSTFGRILKMDSTKKVVRKLAGHSPDTASWCTNIGNEMGQVLMSVLTASEGVGLGPMTAGLRRYQVAGVDPPQILYVDNNCCGGSFAPKKPKLPIFS